MAVAMVSGTAVITPVADLAGTSIAANAADATVVTTEDELRTALAAGGTGRVLKIAKDTVSGVLKKQKISRNK